MKEHGQFQYLRHIEGKFPSGMVVEVGDEYSRSELMVLGEFSPDKVAWFNFPRENIGQQHRGHYTLRRPLKNPLIQHFI